MKKLFKALLITSFLLFLTSPSEASYTEETARNQVRAILNEATASMWSDAEINAWLSEASIDISVRTGCYQFSDQVTLVTGQLEYTTLVTLGANGVSGAVVVWGMIYEGSENYLGLKRIHPSMISTLPHMAPGTPKYFYHFADKIGILPLASSAVSGDTVRFYFSKETDDITAIPDEYQPATFLYAASRAYLKEHRYAESNTMFKMYLEAVQVLKRDLSGVEGEQSE